MALPDRPWVVQINWDDTDPATPWTNTDVDALGTHVQRIEIDRNVFRGTLRGSTATITFTDEGYHLRPGKESSAYYPNVALGRRVRILAQTSPGTYQPHFFGYIRDIQPDPTDVNPPTCTFICDSPLAVLADMEIELPPSVDPKVWDGDDPFHTFLWIVLKGANLYGTNMVSLDNVGQVLMPGTQGDGTRTFAEWLGQCCDAATCVVSDEPLLAISNGDPDWHLRWFKPDPLDAADWSWSALDRELEMTPQIVFNGEMTF